ncbi:transposase [Streptomyces lavenduligriseus]|uniref:transposase n=1 Tax=Streptomyces lavenduligriseus TaxID=67315 RepID=UPI003558ED8D
MYESRPGATIRSVAAGLGVNRETLRNWVRAAGRPGSPVAVGPGRDAVRPGSWCLA